MATPSHPCPECGEVETHSDECSVRTQHVTLFPVRELVGEFMIVSSADGSDQHILLIGKSADRKIVLERIGDTFVVTQDNTFRTIGLPSLIPEDTA